METPMFMDLYVACVGIVAVGALIAAEWKPNADDANGEFHDLKTKSLEIGGIFPRTKDAWEVFDPTNGETLITVGTEWEARQLASQEDHLAFAPKGQSFSYLDKLV